MVKADPAEVIPFTSIKNNIMAFANGLKFLLDFFNLYDEIFNYKSYLVNETAKMNEKLKNDKKNFQEMLEKLYKLVKSIRHPNDYDNEEEINQCIRHFRSVYRKNFRGTVYLSPTTLQEVQTEALDETMDRLKNTEISNKTLVQVKQQLAKEQSWIATINNLRRQSVMDEIKMEVVEIFKAHLLTVVPHLCNDGTDKDDKFYDDNVLTEKLETLKNSCIDVFEEQLPLQEEGNDSLDLTEEVKTYLEEHFINSLTEKNSNRRDNVDAKLKRMVHSAVVKYEVEIKAAAEKSLLLDVDLTIETHNRLKKDFLSEFGKISDSGGCKDEHMKSYNAQIKQILENTIRSRDSTAQNELMNFLNEGRKKEFNKLVEMKLLETLGTCGVTKDQLNPFMAAMEKSFGEVVGSMKGSNQENLNKIMATVKSTDKEELLKEMDMTLENMMKKYKKMLENYVRNENPYWRLKSESRYNRNFHKESKAELKKVLERELRENAEKTAVSMVTYTKSLEEFMDELFREKFGMEPDATPDEIETRWSIRNDITVLKAGSSTTKQLTPLVFQLSPGYIRMGMMVNGEPTLLKAEDGKKFVETHVGLTTYDAVIYGTELKNEPCSCLSRLMESIGIRSKRNKDEEEILKECWNLEKDCKIETPLLLSLDSWSVQIDYKGKKVNITYELLLGFLLKKLKKSAEVELNGECISTVITVPYWLTSPQRIRVKDAAKLAGFTTVYLVNQAAAAAYYASAGAKNPSVVNNIMVFSQHGTDQMELTLYGTARAEDGIREVRLLQRKNVTLDKQWNDGHFEKGLIAVQQTCKDMISSDGVQYGAVMTVAVNWEQNQGDCIQSQVLKRVAREMIEAKEDFSDGQEIVVKGAVLLAENLTRVGTLVRDKLSYDVFAGEGKAHSCDELLPRQVKLKVIDVDLPRGGTIADFSQKSSDNKTYLVGELNVDSVLRGDVVEARLTINHEGIIKMGGIKKRYTRTGNPSIDRDNTFSWKSAKLSDTEMEEQRKLLEEFMIPVEKPVKEEDGMDMDCEEKEEVEEEVPSN